MTKVVEISLPTAYWRSNLGLDEKEQKISHLAKIFCKKATGHLTVAYNPLCYKPCAYTMLFMEVSFYDHKNVR